MRLKRSCRCTTRIGNKHWCFNLHEILCSKETTDSSENLWTLNKCISALLVHNKVHISLTITCVCICKSMILLRKNLQALRKKCQLLCMDRNFTGFCTENVTLHTVNVSDIRLLKICIILLTYSISCYIYLNLTLKVLNVTERSLSHNTLKKHTTGNGNMNRVSIHNCSSLIVIIVKNVLRFFLAKTVCVWRYTAWKKLCFMLLVQCAHVICMMCLIILRNAKRILSGFLQSMKLLATNLKQLVKILWLCLIIILIIILSQFYFLFLFLFMYIFHTSKYNPVSLRHSRIICLQKYTSSGSVL